MPCCHRYRRTSRTILAAALLGLGVGWGLPANAQSGGSRAGNTANMAVLNSCRAELVRLCPEVDTVTRQGRSAAICLKPFKSSLSLPCRKAVRSVYP